MREKVFQVTQVVLMLLDPLDGLYVRRYGLVMLTLPRGHTWTPTSFWLLFYSGWSYLDLWAIGTFPSSVGNLREVFPADLPWSHLPPLPPLSPSRTFPQLGLSLLLVTCAQQLRWAIRYLPFIIL